MSRICSQRARLLRGWLGAAFVGSLLAATPSVADVSGLEVKEYARDFGIAPEQAEGRLKIQDRGTKADIVSKLEGSLGSQYAGVWFDNEKGEFVVPVVGAAAPEKASGILTAIGLRGDSRLTTASSTWSELESTQERVDEALDDLLAQESAQTFPDPKTNSVVIRLSQDADGTQRERVELLAARQSADAEVRLVDEARLHGAPLACHAGERVCGAPLRGGVAIGPFNPGQGVIPICTAGFKATGRYNGNRYVLTAGHCPPADPLSDPAWYTRNADESDLHPRLIGTLEGYSDTVETDWAKYNANGTIWDQGWPTWVVFWGGVSNPKWVVNEAVPISREGKSYLGEHACLSGKTTGTHCGYVTALDVTAYSGGKVHKQHYSEFGPTCVDHGDSGGPVFDDGTALGMVSWGTEWLPVCERYAWYYEITRATDAMAVTVAPRAPDVTTGGVTNFQPRKATIAANVDPNGVSTEYYFEYGTSPSFGSTTVAWGAGSGWDPGQFSGAIDGLKGNTTYHYRLIATNSAGTGIGGTNSFTTPDWRPLVVTKPPTEVKGQKATLNGTVNPQASETKYRFEYGLTTSYGTKVPVPDASVGSGTSTVAVSQKLSGLEDGLYHYRLVAYNSDGTSTGSDQTFLIDNRPLVTIEPATGVSIAAATLNGKVNPQAFASTYRFEYVSEADYKAEGFTSATKVPAPDASAGAGETDVAVSQTVTELEPETTYRYRIVATNIKGTRIGTEASFRTKGPTFTFISACCARFSGVGEVKGPDGLTIDGSGTLYVGNTGYVSKYNASTGQSLGTIGSFGFTDGQFQSASDVAVTASGDIWVMDGGRDIMQKFNSAGQYLSKFGSSTLFESSNAILIDLAGNIWVSDEGHKRILKLSSTGTLLMTITGGGSNGPALDRPRGMNFDSEGDLWVVDWGANRVLQYSPSGTHISSFGVAGSQPGQLSKPEDIVVKPSGDLLV